MSYVSHVTLRRVRHNVIEYDVTTITPGGAEEQSTRTYHANRTATFFGQHTGGGDARQLTGGPRTLWREDDTTLLMAFRRRYPGAAVSYA